jgi:hypothetical protein
VIKLFSVAIVGLLLVGCGTTEPTAQLMPAITFNQPITFHSDKAAILYWDYGKIISVEVNQGNIFEATTLSGMVTHTITQSYKEQYDQNDILINYGKAEQAVFMTSLRNVLGNAGTFKSVIISAEPPKLNPDQMLISVNFEKSAVLRGAHGYPIQLKVVMTVSDIKGRLLKRTFDIKPKNSVGSYLFDDFKDAQIYASQQLMNDIITTLNQLVER